ncbi:MAG: signal peptidase I [bacterium]
MAKAKAVKPDQKIEVKKTLTLWSKVKKPLQVVSTLIEWAVFSLLVVTFLIVLSPLLPTKNYIYTYIVATGSMEKTIMAGSVAFVKPAKIDTLKKGDIITFTSPKDPKATILHRIFEIKEKNKVKTFFTKGDNNNAPDNWVINSMQIKGQYLFSIPYIGHIGAFVKTPKGFGMIVVIPALILALLQVKTIKQGIEEEVEKRTKQALAKAQGSKTLRSVIILAIILNAFAFWGAREYVQAQYISTVTVSGVTFSVIDFIPPSTPTGLRYLSPSVACGGITNSYNITADWGDSFAHGAKHIDHYEYESFNPTTGWMWGPVNVSISQRAGAFTVGEGTYGFRVRAVDNLGYKSDWTSMDFTGSCQITYDVTAPVVSVGQGNNVAPINYPGNSYIPLLNTPSNTGPIHNGTYSGMIPVYATATDAHFKNYHFRIVKEGSTDANTCGASLGDPSNQGYNKCGYPYSTVKTASLSNGLIDTINTALLPGNGTYWLIIGAIDETGNRTAGPTSASNYWHRDPRIRIYVDNTPPTVTIDEVFGHKINGYECGIGSAVSNDGLKINITNWHTNYTLQGRYKIGGGDFGGWVNLTEGLWGSGHFTYTGTSASYTMMNTGSSPAGIAGWEARVLDGSTNQTGNTGTSTYIITTDPDHLACNGLMTMGYQTAETGTLPGNGICPVTTNDRSQNSGNSSLQILKWTALNEASSYRVTGYVHSGANWNPYGGTYTLTLAQVSTSGNVVTYTAYATAEMTTAYYIEALDSLGNVLSYTQPQSIGFTCTFTVDRTKPTSIITTPVNAGSHTTVYIAPSEWDGVISGTAADAGSGVTQVKLSIYDQGTHLYWNGSSWGIGTEATVRVDATGTTSWSYPLTPVPFGTTYTITAHAIDNANNIEDSYVLTIVFPTSTLIITPTPTQISQPAMSLTLSDDKKTISFIVTYMDDIKLSYVLSYDAYSSAKGVLGSDIDVTGMTEYKKEAIDLATCSGEGENRVCTYDQNVTNIKLTVTLVDINGKETKLEKAL